MALRIDTQGGRSRVTKTASQLQLSDGGTKMISRNCERRSVHFMLSLLVALMICSTTFGQAGTSSVTGTVTDPQGNAVAGATILLTNPSKNFSRTQTTNEVGAYSFSSIPPDTYVVEVTATGFKKTIINNVQALVAKPTE